MGLASVGALRHRDRGLGDGLPLSPCAIP